jgi:hypothetical protein
MELIYLRHVSNGILAGRISGFGTIVVLIESQVGGAGMVGVV